MPKIEIPCELGDTIYELVCPIGRKPFYITSTTCAIHISDYSNNNSQHKRVSYIVGRFSETNTVKQYNFNLIGKKIFFSKLDVIRAITDLQERRNNE